MLTSHLLTLLAATALDEKYRHARPKRLRFAIFNYVGTMVSQAGRMVMQVISRVLAEVIGPSAPTGDLVASNWDMPEPRRQAPASGCHVANRATCLCPASLMAASKAAAGHLYLEAFNAV